MKKINFNFRYNHKIGIFTLSSLFFLYLLYLSIPSLYNTGRVQKVINDKFITDFNLNISLSTDISYRILPQPHFLIKDAKLFYKKSNLPYEISHIKELKIYISKKNFFNKKNIEILKVELNKSNFFIMKNDFIFFEKYFNKKFSEKEIVIKKSKFFLNDDNKNIIFIYTINKSKINFDLDNDTNYLSTKGEIYKIPVKLNWTKNFTTKKKIMKLSTKKLSIDLLNEGNFIDGKYEYENVLDLFSSRLKTKYKILDQSLVFKSEKSLIKSTPINYNGIINFKPFNFKINIDTKKLDFSHLWKNIYLLNELIITELLLNQNLYGNILISSEKITKLKNFNNASLNINFKESEINFDNTKIYSDKLGELEVYDSTLKSIKGVAILSAKLKFKIKNQDFFNKIFLIPKKNRKKIKNIIFDTSFQLEDNSINIDGVSFEENKNKIKNFDSIDEIIETNKRYKYDYLNPILFRKFIKEIIINYSHAG